MSYQTEPEARAARLRWPLGVQGYSPNEPDYWVEPGFGWASALLNPQAFGLSPAACRRELARLRTLPLVWNAHMAPRFPPGTFLAGRRLRVGQPVPVGAIVCFWLPGSAPDCPEFARVVRLHGGELRLACDNGQRPYCLPWTRADARRVGRVYRATHYVRLPYVY